MSHCTEGEPEAQRRARLAQGHTGRRSTRSLTQVASSCLSCGISVAPIGTGIMIELVTELRCTMWTHSCLELWHVTISEPQFPHLQHGNASLTVSEDYERECMMGPLKDRAEASGGNTAFRLWVQLTTRGSPAVGPQTPPRRRADEHPTAAGWIPGTLVLQQASAKPARARRPQLSPQPPGRNVSPLCSFKHPQMIQALPRGGQKGPLTQCREGL